MIMGKKYEDMFECELLHHIEELVPKLNEAQRAYLDLQSKHRALTYWLERNYGQHYWFSMDKERRDNLIAEYHLLHKEQ